MSSRPVVLMIDEVDSAGNNQVFIDILAQLRGYYLARDEMPIFHSVILAGVYSIKNLKSQPYGCDFNQKKEIGVKEIPVDGKTIVEAVV